MDQEEKRYMFFDEVPVSTDVKFDVTELNQKIYKGTEIMLK